MTDQNSSLKIIAVSDGTERESYFLEQILAYSRREAFKVLPVQEAISRGQMTAALLTDQPEICCNLSLFPVCVTEFQPDRKAEITGFQKVVTYSAKWDSATFTARNIRCLPEGITAFEIVGVGIIGRVRLRTVKTQEVKPALAAAAAAIAAGIPFAETLEALNHLSPL